MNVFIDANIFLYFYQFSKDDLEELNKLKVLLTTKDIKLWLPDQVREEMRRKRESIIATALKDLKEQRISFPFPAMSKQYPEHEKLRELQKEYGKHHASLIAQITKDAGELKLTADGTLGSLIVLADPIKISEEIYNKAKQRHERGNPPGKPNSLGDAINWEALLNSVPKGEDIHFITDDNDYASVLDKTKFSPFLAYEWQNLKESELSFYKSLSEFFQAKYPNVNFALDLEKSIALQKFVGSSNFANTHLAIARLSRFKDFTVAQTNEIVTASLSNNQILWIVDDEDVKLFLTSVITGKEGQIDTDNLNKLNELLNPPTKPDPEDDTDNDDVGF